MDRMRLIGRQVPSGPLFKDAQGFIGVFPGLAGKKSMTAKLAKALRC